MFVLYVKTGCPYCARVLHKVEELGLTPDIKNVSDPTVVQELIERGGKRQEPFLYDAEKSVALYESTNIIQYLEKEYGKKV
jgi:glutathione S-transferase